MKPEIVDHCHREGGVTDAIAMKELESPCATVHVYMNVVALVFL